MADIQGKRPAMILLAAIERVSIGIWWLSHNAMTSGKLFF